MLHKCHNTYVHFCTHVLPLVYDDSLSYYEVLCKLCEQMKNLWESQQEVIKITEAAQEIVETLFPEFKEEIEEKLAEYEEAYQQYTDKWDEALKQNELDIEEFRRTLTESLQNQDKTIQENNTAQLELINQRLGSQDVKIELLENTVENAINAQNQSIKNFIDTYNPVRVMLPEVTITFNQTGTIIAYAPSIEPQAISCTANVPVVFKCPEYGVWRFEGLSPTINPVIDVETTLNIDDVKQYNITLDGSEPVNYTINVSTSVPVDVATLFDQGVYQCVSPSGVTKTLPCQHNTITTFTVDEPGTYTVKWLAANVIPDSSRSEGFTKTGQTLIYTDMQSNTVTLTPHENEKTTYFQCYYTALKFKPESRPFAYSIKPPVVTEFNTLSEWNNDILYLIPWAKGQWIWEDDDGFNKGYTYSDVNSNHEFDMFPQPLWHTETERVTIPWRGNIQSSETLSQISTTKIVTHKNNVAERAGKLHFNLCGVAVNGRQVGYIPFSSRNPDGTYSYQYEDETDFLPSHYLCLYIPTFTWGLALTGDDNEVTGINIIPGRYNTTNPLFKDITNGKSYQAIAITLANPDMNNNNTIPQGVPAQRNYTGPVITSPTLNNSLPPNCEVIRAEQFLYILLTVYGGTVNERFQMSQSYNRDFTDIVVGSTTSIGLGTFTVLTAVLSTNAANVASADGNAYPVTSTNKYTLNSSITSGYESFPNAFMRILYPTSSTKGTDNGAIGHSLRSGTTATGEHYFGLGETGDYSGQLLSLRFGAVTLATHGVFYLY